MTVKLNSKKHKGYINCRRLNKTIYIYKFPDEAFEHPQYGWLCSCGNWTKLDPYYHSGICEGKDI